MKVDELDKNTIKGLAIQIAKAFIIELRTILDKVEKDLNTGSDLKQALAAEQAMRLHKSVDDIYLDKEAAAQSLIKAFTSLADVNTKKEKYDA